METQTFNGNPDGWYKAFLSLVQWIGDHNPTPLHPHMVLFLLACIAVIGGCWWIWTTWLRPPKATGGGH